MPKYGYHLIYFLFLVNLIFKLIFFLILIGIGFKWNYFFNRKSFLYCEWEPSNQNLCQSFMFSSMLLRSLSWLKPFHYQNRCSLFRFVLLLERLSKFFDLDDFFYILKYCKKKIKWFRFRFNLRWQKSCWFHCWNFIFKYSILYTVASNVSYGNPLIFFDLIKLDVTYRD